MHPFTHAHKFQVIKNQTLITISENKLEPVKAVKVVAKELDTIHITYTSQKKARKVSVTTLHSNMLTTPKRIL